jgi:hypothetical protein
LDRKEVRLAIKAEISAVVANAVALRHSLSVKEYENGFLRYEKGSNHLRKLLSEYSRGNEK